MEAPSWRGLEVWRDADVIGGAPHLQLQSPSTLTRVHQSAEKPKSISIINRMSLLWSGWRVWLECGKLMNDSATFLREPRICIYIVYTK